MREHRDSEKMRIAIQREKTYRCQVLPKQTRDAIGQDDRNYLVNLFGLELEGISYLSGREFLKFTQSKKNEIYVAMINART